MKRKKMGNIVREFKKRYGIDVALEGSLAEKRPEELGAEKFAEILVEE